MLLFQGCLSLYWRQVALRTMSWRLNSIRNIFALLTVCMAKKLRLMERSVTESLKNYVFEQQLVAFSCGYFFTNFTNHDDVIKWKHFPRYRPFVRGIHRSPVKSPHKGQWRGAVMFSLICVWINDWVNNREAGDFRRYRTHYDVIAMWSERWSQDLCE